LIFGLFLSDASSICWLSLLLAAIDIEIFEAHAGDGQAINIGCLYNRIPVATEVVGSMLVGDDEEKIDLVWRFHLAQSFY
jgi:hypothetical protein